MKLIFSAEKLCLIAFITVNIKELLYDGVGTRVLERIVSLLLLSLACELYAKALKCPREALKSESSVFLL